MRKPDRQIAAAARRCRRRNTSVCVAGWNAAAPGIIHEQSTPSTYSNIRRSRFGETAIRGVLTPLHRDFTSPATSDVTLRALATIVHE